MAILPYNLLRNYKEINIWTHISTCYTDIRICPQYDGDLEQQSERKLFCVRDAADRGIRIQQVG